MNIAFIPARSGSKRLPGKNIRMLGGIPLLCHSVRAAWSSGVFEHVFLITDSADYLEIGMACGAESLGLRPASISGDDSPDIDWLTWALDQLESDGIVPEIVSILRPTSPFRSGSIICEAMRLFLDHPTADSLRAVSKSNIHPGKMWVLGNCYMQPLLPFNFNGVIWHSTQTAALPTVYFQNASLEIARHSSVRRTKSIAGEIVLPFVSGELDSLDINTESDFRYAEYLLDKGLVTAAD